MAAGIPGASLIPDRSELFLGFTSTQKQGLGPPRIANLETLGYSNGGRDGYFRKGTTMHLSHITEDLESWYINFDFAERAATTFRPGLRVKDGAMTVRQGPKDTATAAQNAEDYRRDGRIGHSAAIQTASRLQHDVLGSDGTRYPKGTAVPQRADFNTLDNPFSWSADPGRDGMQPGPAAGVHFVVFTPDERRLPSRPAGHGRRPAGRHEARVHTARPRSGLQLGADDDPPPELSRAATAAPLVPARRVAPVVAG